MSNARAVTWDQEGVDHVADHDELTQFLHKKPKKGDIITARYMQANVRMKVLDREGNDTSIAEVLGISVEDERRVEEHEGLRKGETVLIPDKDRAFIRYSD
ncbi:hypothetical protein GCM10010082_11760 [Kushneria pakistanensis]|uniref:CDC48 N-terminal subdomain domain-containing protein n=1 Tax=Kushneria pakistanensis TaxID=1508770 RepID=A0ABQ3FEW6_9GAMM|nr:hypothetical protein [Kushneria pakistanensis]GHC21655.1 hypothetical protein GCM10010082_11760 [Kushneria pakistanensis]